MGRSFHRAPIVATIAFRVMVDVYDSVSLVFLYVSEVFNIELKKNSI